jgi:hypothetical protein
VLRNEKSTFSTIEAIAKSLDTLHHPKTLKYESAFVEALKYSVDAVMKQRGRENVFGNVIVPKASEESISQDSYTKPFHERPPRCHICEKNEGFKNLGLVETEMGTEKGSSEGTVCSPTPMFERRWRCRACEAVFATAA